MPDPRLVEILAELLADDLKPLDGARAIAFADPPSVVVQLDADRPLPRSVARRVRTTADRFDVPVAIQSPSDVTSLTDGVGHRTPVAMAAGVLARARLSSLGVPTESVTHDDGERATVTLPHGHPVAADTRRLVKEIAERFGVRLDVGSAARPATVDAAADEWAIRELAALGEATDRIADVLQVVAGAGDTAAAREALAHEFGWDPDQVDAVLTLRPGDLTRVMRGRREADLWSLRS